MGNHHSHDSKGGGDHSGSGTSTPRGSQRGAGSRSGSGGDLQGLTEAKEKPPLSLVPVEKLGKGGHWLSTIFLTYCAALPLHLLIELPAMRFLQSLTA